MNGERGLGAAQFGIGGSGNSANNTSASGSSTTNNNNYQKPFNYHCCASSSGYQNIGRVQVPVDWFQFEWQHLTFFS